MRFFNQVNREALTTRIRFFVESSALCRMLSVGHSAKKSLSSAALGISPALGNDRVYRKQDSQHKNTLSKENFAECQILGERWRLAKSHQEPSIADDRYLCRALGFSTRQRSLSHV
jgi:hypothetical protein